MKIITHKRITDLKIPPAECYTWVSEMIANKKNALLPPKISMKPTDGVFCNVMPCIINYADGGRFGGVKVVTRYPQRVPTLDSKLILQDSLTGEFLALMDANWITSMRTGAVAAHSVLQFAKKNFKTVGLIGLGNTVIATLLVLLSVRPELCLNVKLLRYKGQEKTFEERFSAYVGLHFTECDTAEELVRGSDVVISGATYLPNDLCGDECFDEGVLVVPIHTLGFTNCDLFFDKVFADDYGHVCHFKNFEKFHSFAEVSDVVNGVVAGRTSDRERILVYNIGVSMHDINFAAHIYPLAEEGAPEIDFEEPQEKTYI